MKKEKIVKVVLTVLAIAVPFGLISVGGYYGYKKYKEKKDKNKEEDAKLIENKE